MNQLQGAASPYLRQHATNPVDWRMWGPEALDEAKRAGKPILLSVGYAACHWCHVMAHESFEDPATAEIMNALFLNIKVDREERPDVDHFYMSALHAFGQRGGWPLTMFLTPDAEPFWGGTYFPNVARYGQPAFISVLKSVERAFRADPSRIATNTKAILEHLGRSARTIAPTVTAREMDELAARLADHMDAANGGMQGAPKFPNPQILEFLWRAAERSAVPSCRERVLLSLERMCQGGIYDHLGGGFARYAVDERWLVPHFEKMLYDNAQLLELLALAATSPTTPTSVRALFAARADETVDWLNREMLADDGTFCASLDADSDGVEGKFYVWTKAEIDECLGADSRVFCAAYGVTEAGNWEEPHGPAVTILNRLDGQTHDYDGETHLATLRAKLLSHRAGRARPGLDDKILADWNGLMITALVRAGIALDHTDWVDRAAIAYGGIMDKTATMADGRLRLAHSRRGTSQVKPAFALDYASMARAALALAEARGAASARNYVGEARALLETLLTVHRDGRLLCMAASDAGDVPLRLRPTTDDAIPNAHPVALDALLRLAMLTGEQRWRDEADALLTALSGAVQANFVGHVGTLNALDLRLRETTIILAGPERESLRDAALQTSWLTRAVIDLVDAAALPAGHPAQAQVDAAGPAAAAFVCHGRTCSLPVRDAEGLRACLAENG